MRKLLWVVGGAVISCVIGVPAFAGFPSTETYLAAVGRVTGQGGAQFYTTIWATNLTSAPVSFTFDFLKQGQANTTPVSFTDSLAPGQTRVYENVVESRLGLVSAIGAARVVSTGEILLAERIYNQPPGADVGNTEGLFFAGVPKSFSISLGQSASIQGINQGGAQNFRYNFALVETGGGSPTVNVQLVDGSGTMLGQKAYVLQPYEQIQPNVTDLFPEVATVNARITATVTGGSGSALLAGAQIANVSQDSSGFEMSFRDDLLGGAGTAGVTSLNALKGSVSLIAGNDVTLTTVGNGIKIDAAGGVSSLNSLKGALSITAGTGISVNSSGSSIQVAYTGGGSSGITSVTHDATLTGEGTGASPLGVAPGGVGTLQLSAAGSTSGQVLASTGSVVAWQNDGLTLPYSASAAVDGGYAFFVTNTGGSGHAIHGRATAASGGSTGVVGESDFILGVGGYSEGGTNLDPIGEVGVFGAAHSGAGVIGSSVGDSGLGGFGLKAGVWGDSASHPGVIGTSSSAEGVLGLSDAGAHAGVHGQHNDSGGNYAGVEGQNLTTGGEGYLGGHEYGVAGVAPTSGSPVYAGEFIGNVSINGAVHTNGVGAIRFDDPGDPANKTITHAFVGSSEMKNIYDGVVTLSASGTATVTLPSWFETINKDFRYQLTALGTPQAGLFISREVADNQFTIAGGVPGARVSWQVTGVRRDPWAASHAITVQEDKPPSEKGLYIVPELYAQPKTKSSEALARQLAGEAKSSTER